MYVYKFIEESLHFPSQVKGRICLMYGQLGIFRISSLFFVIHINSSVIKSESPQHFLFPKYTRLLWSGYIKPTNTVWKPSCNALNTNVETASGISRSAWHQEELKRSRKPHFIICLLC